MLSFVFGGLLLEISYDSLGSSYVAPFCSLVYCAC